jgi:hypothetical protein
MEKNMKDKEFAEMSKQRAIENIKELLLGASLYVVSKKVDTDTEINGVWASKIKASEVKENTTLTYQFTKVAFWSVVKNPSKYSMVASSRQKIVRYRRRDTGEVVAKGGEWVKKDILKTSLDVPFEDKNWCYWRDMEELLESNYYINSGKIIISNKEEVKSLLRDKGAFFRD